MNKKNILFITADQLRFDCLGCNGNPIVKTPNIDRLAAMGMNFQKHYCSAPVCSPARSSMITGKHARSHGLFALGYELPEDSETLPEILAGHGYSTGLVGKAHFEALESRRTENFDHSKPYYGFEECHVTEDDVIGEYMDWIKDNYPDYTYKALENTSASFREKPYPKMEDGKINEMFISPLPEELHQTAWITDHAIDFIDRKKDESEPFLLWCSYVDPHHPWNPPERFARMYSAEDMILPEGQPGEDLLPEYWYLPDMKEEEIRKMIASYYALITFTDEYIGKVLDHLEAEGLMEDTIIVFTSDHGDYNGDRGLIRKCWRLYEGITHIPLMVYSPDHQRTGKGICNGFTQDVDFLPTLLELCGIEHPLDVQGISFAGTITDNRETTERDYTVCEFTMQNHPFGDHNWNIAMRSGDMKLTYYPFEDRYYLVDLSDDPYEYENLIDNEEYSSDLMTMKSQLLDWFLKTKIYMRQQQYNW